MSHHDFDATTIAVALELLSSHGFDGLARPLEMLFNEAMGLERDAYLGAGPWEHSEERRGYANGFKAKTVQGRVGELEMRVPKASDLAEGVDPLYPQPLERGSRIEQSLRLALAEMYVQGVSTRKVKDITEQLCALRANVGGRSAPARSPGLQPSSMVNLKNGGPGSLVRLATSCSMRPKPRSARAEVCSTARS